VTEDLDLLPSAPVVQPFFAPWTGYVAALDARVIGMAAVQLGAGRMTVTDSVDPGVGFDVLCRVGERVERDEVLAYIHARDEDSATLAAQSLGTALELSESPTSKSSVIGAAVESGTCSPGRISVPQGPWTSQDSRGSVPGMYDSE